MKKIISLLKATMSQDMNLFRIKTKNSSKLGKLVLPIFVTIIIMGMFASYAAMFIEELSKTGASSLVLLLFISGVSIITVIESIYKSQGILFEAKDTDLLFSLPISKTKIFFTRVFKMLSFQTLYNALFLIPVFAVYAIYEKPGFVYYIVSFLMLFLNPILPTIIGCIFGYLIKGISTKLKAKNVVQVILSMLALLLVLFSSFSIQSLMENLIQNAEKIAETVTKVYYPAGVYLKLIQNFNILDFLLIIAVNFIPAIVFIYVSSIFYFKITSKTMEKGAAHKKNNRKVNNEILENKIKVKTPIKALIFKELKRFFSSPVFIINSGFAIVLLAVVTIGISINFDSLVNGFIQEMEMKISVEEIRQIMPKIFLGFIIYSECMTSITSSMISLEGKSFNILKSLPIKEEKILLAKILTSHIISVPVTLICDLIFFITFKPSVIDIILIFAASIIIPTFTAMVGLLMNLKYPKMNAETDTEVVKQSTSSMFSVFIGMLTGLIAIAFIVIGAAINVNLFVAIELAIFLIIDLVLWRKLKKKGVKQFREINV